VPGNAEIPIKLVALAAEKTPGLNQVGLNQVGLKEAGLNQVGLNQVGLNQVGAKLAEL
jgi:hypothetical protein